MTWTYTPGGATDQDDIRSALGDTESSAPTSERLEDEEIARFLTLYGSAPAATVAAAKALMAKLSRRATEKSVGGLQLVYAQRIEGLQYLIGQLTTAASGLAMPYCGGISQGTVAAVEADADRVQPAFRRGMLDNPRAS